MLTEPTEEPGELFERSVQLAALAEMLTAAAGSGSGRLALVYGEAGVGKTSLVRRFTEDAPASAGVLWGKCDDLFTPRPLGPLFDIAASAGRELSDVLREGGTPYEVATVLAEMLLSSQAPSIVVLEDLHLADEATLDVLRILGARASGLPAVIVATYRDDAMDRWHPLRLVLGEVAAAAPITRLRLARLSPDAVTRMAAAYGTLSEEIYLKTGGNPFFVTEVLASADEHVPETVRDAVLGRTARLSKGARRLIDAVAVAGPQSELWLLEELAQDDVEFLEETITAGIVTPGRGTVAFRHELARLAVEESVPVRRRAAMHRQALELLAERAVGEPDPARLAHHAEAVGEAELVLRFAPLAAQQASRLGAHREAAVHYRRALRFADLAPLDIRASLSAGCAQESFLIVEFPEAVEAQRQALSCCEDLGDPQMQGAALVFLAHLLWQTGSLSEALETVQRALSLLEASADRWTVEAYCEMARLQLAAELPAQAGEWAQRAQLLADRLHHESSRIWALQTVGWVEYFSDIPGGAEKLVDCLEAAKRSGLGWEAITTCVIIVRTACRRREYNFAETYIRVGLELCSVDDFDVYRYYLLSWQSKVLLAAGRWSDAADVAQICLADPCPFARIHALVALGLVRARRGDPDVWAPLDEALALAEPRNELQWIAPVAIARAEAAWLEGRPEDAEAETQTAYEAGAAGTSWAAGLAYWRWRAGAEQSSPDLGEEQFRLEMAGDCALARERWLELGCPYEAAVALLGGDEAGLQLALAELREMGAVPATKIAASRLREIGARGVPRGPRPQTRENPAGLTPRELEVLGLLTEGLRNAQIAQRLVVSEKTVDHHVSAVLRKLDVRTRGEAGAAATRLGLSSPS